MTERRSHQPPHPDELAQAIAAAKAEASAAGLTDAEIDAELAAYNTERRDAATAPDEGTGLAAEFRAFRRGRTLGDLKPKDLSQRVATEDRPMAHDLILPGRAFPAAPGAAAAAAHVPALVQAAGERAGIRFLEFFAAGIRNPHTRRAYMRSAADFLAWCEATGVASIAAVQPLQVATWIEMQTRERSAPTAKLRLAALRHLFDWLVTGQVIPANPAASVRGPRHSATKGKTPVLDAAETRQLLDSIDVATPVGLRDRALIALMVYSFARIGAALGMRVEDVYTQGRRLWVRLREKGGKRHEMPCHHTLEAYLHAYIEGTGIGDDPKGPLFRTVGRGTGRLTHTPLPQANAYAMIQRRAALAGIETKIGSHTFRATGITAYLKNGGTLENAAAMANHASTRTTQLYGRRRDEISLDEVERIRV